MVDKRRCSQSLWSAKPAADDRWVLSLSARCLSLVGLVIGLVRCGGDSRALGVPCGEGHCPKGYVCCGSVGCNINLEACGGGAAMQTWDVTAQTGGAARVARATCQGGACTASAWNIGIPGCTYRLTFDVQFSGTAVGLLNFRKTTDSTCGGVMLAQSFGTGTSDAPYPTATQAMGTFTLTYTSPLGPAGGTGNWTATRVR